MAFGLQFFPSVSPSEKSAEQYWSEALHRSVYAMRWDTPMRGLWSTTFTPMAGTRQTPSSFSPLPLCVQPGFEIASLQVNFNTLAVDDAERSMRLFAEEVMPHITA